MQEKVKIIFDELFYTLSLTILLFFGLEYIISNSVIAYINMNLLLIFWMIIAIFIVVLNKNNG